MLMPPESAASFLPFLSLPFFSFLSAMAFLLLQTAAALRALALEDEAHQAAVVALADVVEADRPVAARVGAHDRAAAHDRRAAGGSRETELHPLADLQRVGAGKEHPPAAEVHGVA